MSKEIPNGSFSPEIKGATTPLERPTDDIGVVRDKAALVERRIPNERNLFESAEFWTRQNKIIRNACDEKQITGEQSDRWMGVIIANIEIAANTDPLTSFYNRRGIIRQATRIISKAERTRRNVSFSIIDLDQFKAFNTAHGHHGGDMVLTEFSDYLRETSRDYDDLARWGGEEFIKIMDERNENEAIDILQVQVMACPEMVGEGLRNRGLIPVHPVTMSVGVATYNPDEYEKMYGDRDKQLEKVYQLFPKLLEYENETERRQNARRAEEIRKERIVNNILFRADKALYAAKTIGEEVGKDRNKVVAFLQDIDDDGNEDNFYYDSSSRDLYVHSLVDVVEDGERKSQLIYEKIMLKSDNG